MIKKIYKINLYKIKFQNKSKINIFIFEYLIFFVLNFIIFFSIKFIKLLNKCNKIMKIYLNLF
jgi:hypothetical protein